MGYSRIGLIFDGCVSAWLTSIGSALMFGGKPLTIIELAQDGQVELAISEYILNETLRVLRDKLKKAAEQLQETEMFVRAITKRISPTETIEVRVQQLTTGAMPEGDAGRFPLGDACERPSENSIVVPS
jgi:hypothetical protein